MYPTNLIILRLIQTNIVYLNYNLFHEVFGALNGAAAVVVEQVEKDQQVEVTVDLKEIKTHFKSGHFEFTFGSSLSYLRSERFQCRLCSPQSRGRQ